MSCIQDLLNSIDSVRKEAILLVDKSIFCCTDYCVPEDINIGHGGLKGFETGQGFGGRICGMDELSEV
jgi:hypothetical protein